MEAPKIAAPDRAVPETTAEENRSDPSSPPQEESEDIRVMEAGVLAEDNLVSISLEVFRECLFVGDQPLIKVNGHFRSGRERDITEDEEYPVSCSSTDPNVISVEKNGVLARAPGEARIDVAVNAEISASVDFTVQEISSAKSRRSYYTEEKIAAARKNVKLFDWAAVTANGEIEKADRYLAQYSLDDLWYLVTPQSIPRSYASDPEQKLGSPITGHELYEKYGNYPWKTDPDHPWKLIDPTTEMMFPTNDFAGYYRLGLDDFGVFNPQLAKQRNDALVGKGEQGYLVNILYPERGAAWGVDDGYGWWDGENHYTFVAYYAHWHGGWHGSGTFMQALKAFGNAYMYTGEEKYGTAGIILLDRIADLYPDMDTSGLRAQGFLNSDGLANRGKGVGCIWEAAAVKIVLAAYDQLWPAAENRGAIDFLKKKAGQYHLGILKSSATGIRRNIEDNYVCQMFPAFKAAKIRGNNGMHQSALAMAAVVYDTLPETKEWLDYDFQAGTSSATAVTGGNILASLVDTVDRNGFGNEASPGYNDLWLDNYEIVADILEGYDRYEGGDLYENVKFRKMFTGNTGLTLSGKFIPLIGDTGKTGAPSSLLDLGKAVKAFSKYGDPVHAQVAYMLNGDSIQGLHNDIFTENPNQVAEDIQETVDRYGTFHLDSNNLTGYGLAALREGKNSRKTSGLTYNFPSMTVLDTNGGFVVYENSGTLQFENTAGAGQYIEFGFNVEKGGLYDVQLQPFGAASYGVYDICVDNEKVLSLDFNIGGGANAEAVSLGRFNLSAGSHSIRFVCTGTTGSNYKMGVIRLTLQENASTAEKKDVPENTLRDLWMYYGRTAGHGHSDTLNIGIHGYGADLTPELGYPETADNAPHRRQWLNNTIAHNTVVVDRSRQENIIVANPLHFEDGELVKLVDVRSPESYSSASEYRRTTAMVRVDEENSYYVDFFRITGGDEHLFSFHGAEGTVATEGAELQKQNGGSYAGKAIEYGSNDPSGFAWLKNVTRAANPEKGFRVDWDIADTWKSFTNPDDDVHLSLTMLTDVDELALADGIPPQNKPGNPKSLRYMLAKRKGKNLDSNFVSVIEPYVSERTVKSIKEVNMKADGRPVRSNDAKAVKVMLKNGRTDYIVYSTDGDAVYTVDDKFEFQGFFGVYTEENGVQTGGYLCDAGLIGSYSNESPKELTGTITDFTKELSTENEITVKMDLQGISPCKLTGKFIYVAKQGTFNGSYRIDGVKTVQGDLVTLDIGDITLINQYADASHMEKGFVYNIAEGQKAVIPLSSEGALPPATDMVFVRDSLSLKGSSQIIGNAGTNAGKPGSVNFGWSTGIKGNLLIGPEGDPKEVVKGDRPDPGENVSGEITSFPSIRKYAQPKFPEFPRLSDRGDIKAGWQSGDSSVIEESGAYDKIEVTKELTVNVGEKDVEAVAGDLSVTGKGCIRVHRTGKGRLILYVKEELNLANSGRINPEGSSDDIFLYYAGDKDLDFGGSTSVNGSLFSKKANLSLSGSGSLTGSAVIGGRKARISGHAQMADGVLYAPDADLMVSGSGRIRGTAVGKSLELSGSAGIRYDSSIDTKFLKQLKW